MSERGIRATYLFTKLQQAKTDEDLKAVVKEVVNEFEAISQNNSKLMSHNGKLMAQQIFTSSEIKRLYVLVIPTLEARVAVLKDELAKALAHIGCPSKVDYNYLEGIAVLGAPSPIIKGEMKEYLYNPNKIPPTSKELAQALRWALDWIDAVPSGAQLPTMPGFDRDYVEALLEDVDSSKEGGQ